MKKFIFIILLILLSNKIHAGEVVVGQSYRFMNLSNDPFYTKEDAVVIYIIGVKQGWLMYSAEDCKGPSCLKFSSRINDFLIHYELIKEE